MFELVIGILFPVFALAAVGFAIGRWLKPDFGPINRINMNIFIPALVFASMSTMSLDVKQLPLLSASLFAVVIPALLMLPICRIFKLNYKTWTPPHMFRNSGNLAIPLFSYAFGDSVMAPAILLFVVSTCAHISIGSAMLSQGNALKQVLRMPVFCAAFLALLLNFSGIGVWTPLHDATTLLGQPAVPVMLLSLGAQMCNIRLSGVKFGMQCTALSLFTGGCAFIAIYHFIPLPSIHLKMMLLFTMLPPAVMNYLFAERFSVEPEKVASMVLFSNLFSILTLPVILSFALSMS